MQSTQTSTSSRARPSMQPLEPVQILSRVLAILLAILPLTLILTAAAWRPLQESTDRGTDRVGASPASYAQTGDRANRPLLVPGEGPLAED